MANYYSSHNESFFRSPMALLCLSSDRDLSLPSEMKKKTEANSSESQWYDMG